MEPLKGCKICEGLGEYMDRIEERGGVNVLMFEPCPCRDREEDPITPEEFEAMHEDGILRGGGVNSIRQTLIDKAKDMYGNIRPCGYKTDLSECFTYEMGGVQLWFNTDRDDSTRMIEEET